MRKTLLALALCLAPLPAHAALPYRAAELAEMFRAYGDTTPDGWTGADGAYSVPLPDGRIAWLFSDTFLGPVNRDGSRSRSSSFIHNSIVVQDGTSLTTIYGDDAPIPLDAIRPSPPGGFYWMGDGTVEGDELKVFVFRFVAAPAPFAFHQVATDLATLSLPDLEVVAIEHLPLGYLPAVGNGPVTYGNALLEDGAHTYVFGVEDLHLDKFLHVARAPRGSVAGPWEFFDGRAWTANPLTSARLLRGVSNEMSVQRDGERFVLIAQESNRVIASVADAPEGPWELPRTVFTTPETSPRFTYNAKAHPELSDAGTLLVTYNVNTFDANELYDDVTVYRPRFVEIAMP